MTLNRSVIREKHLQRGLMFVFLCVCQTFRHISKAHCPFFRALENNASFLLLSYITHTFGKQLKIKSIAKFKIQMSPCNICCLEIV